MFNYRMLYPFGLNRKMCGESKTEEKHLSYPSLNKVHPRISLGTN